MNCKHDWKYVDSYFIGDTEIEMCVCSICKTLNHKEATDKEGV